MLSYFKKFFFSAANLTDNNGKTTFKILLYLYKAVIKKAMDELKKELKIDQYELLSHKVYKILKSAIIKEQFKPGTHIMEESIARELNISRTPVREAVKRLVAEKYLINIPNTGVFVPEISLFDLIEVLEIRLALEGFASFLAAKRAIPEDIVKLENILEKMNKLDKDQNKIEFSEYNSEFHNCIFDIADNKRLKELYLDLIVQPYQTRIKSIRTPNHLNTIIQEHHTIVQAIKDKDPEKAQQVSQKHIEGMIKNVKEYQNNSDILDTDINI